VESNVKATILLVDDSRFVRLAAAKTLSRAGYTVIEAGEGQPGLQLAREKTPDLILLDVMLPDLPGLSVLRALKGDEKTAKIPVIMLTGLSAQESKELPAEGAAALLEKSDTLFAQNAIALVRLIESILAKPS
jgi:CheY-like chemotaxis protein